MTPHDFRSEVIAEPEVVAKPEVVAEEKITVEVSVYDLAYIRSLQDYAIYYLVDTDEKVVKNILTNDTGVLVGKYTGDFNNGIDIIYSGGNMHE